MTIKYQDNGLAGEPYESLLVTLERDMLEMFGPLDLVPEPPPANEDGTVVLDGLGCAK